ncbi:MAG: hypothetical protein AOA65_1361 [Candidatus Bathyarchaeota archaeon BA1]|nr:MAG: hypothetical protein AOA65_1361 [Candidatus Bathyarchaeota archaeon BA1]
MGMLLQSWTLKKFMKSLMVGVSSARYIGIKSDGDVNGSRIVLTVTSIRYKRKKGRFGFSDVSLRGVLLLTRTRLLFP